MATKDKPLEGLKVIDFTRVYSGPYCTMMLGDLGAEIIKVERKGLGDDTHFFQPIKGDESGYFAYFNRNKKSLSLDLKDPDAVQIIKDLAKWADVVVENFSPGVVDRLGIGYEDLKAVNPKIIYGSISGFGQTGPYKSKSAYDVICQAMGGYMATTGEKGGKPYKLGPSAVDGAAGIHMSFAILAAVLYREKTGVGQYIDIGMMDTAVSTLENFLVWYTLLGEAPSRNGNCNLGSAPFNTFDSKDGYVAIATGNNRLWSKLCKLMDREELLERPGWETNSSRKEHEYEVDAEVEKWTSQLPTADIVRMCDEVGVPAGSVMEIDEIAADPHVAARDMLVEIDHPLLGPVKYPGNPCKFSETSEFCFERAPLLGEHNDYVLKDILGMSDERIEELKAKDIF